MTQSRGPGRKADVWALGCTVLEMLTGRRPWPRFENQLALILHVATSHDTPLDRGAVFATTAVAVSASVVDASSSTSGYAATAAAAAAATATTAAVLACPPVRSAARTGVGSGCGADAASGEESASAYSEAEVPNEVRLLYALPHPY